MNIEEMIADAKAEEEVKATQEKSENNDFRDALRERLKETFTNRAAEKVSVSLDEYVLLKIKERDLDLLLNAIVKALGLSYSKEYLTIRHDEEITSVFKALYSEAYDILLKTKQEAGDE